MTETTDVVQSQVDAYNNRDGEAFAAAYAPDATVAGNDGQVIATGRSEIQAMYHQLFDQSPALHVDVVNRLAAGEWVIDEEHARGLVYEGMPDELHGFVAYQVKDDLIVHARFMS